MRKRFKNGMAVLMAIILSVMSVDLTAFAGHVADAETADTVQPFFLTSDGELEDAPENFGAAEPGSVTRIEWIRNILTTFDMEVASEDYPDNYYSDVNASDPYYADIMVATEFGLIDTQAGEAFRPEEARPENLRRTR